VKSDLAVPLLRRASKKEKMRIRKIFLISQF
jgi:hypothetical protein